MTIIVYTDGVLDAGIKHGARFDIVKLVAEELRDENVGAQQLADAILARANELDRGRPGDDTSVLVVRIVPSTEEDTARRMTVRLPID